MIKPAICHWELHRNINIWITNVRVPAKWQWHSRGKEHSISSGGQLKLAHTRHSLAVRLWFVCGSKRRRALNQVTIDRLFHTQHQTVPGLSQTHIDQLECFMFVSGNNLGWSSGTTADCILGLSRREEGKGREDEERRRGRWMRRGGEV